MVNQLTDTLTANKAIVESFRNNPTYNYDRQLGSADTSLVGDFIDAIARFLREMLDIAIPESDSQIWPVIATGAVLVAVCALCFCAFRIFKPRGVKNTVDYDIEHEDINTIDFDKEIAGALAAGNYRNACRLVYLKTLKVLSDNGVIDWKLFKTPTQYTAEVHDPDFNSLTNHFLKVRYGDFKATRALYDEMLMQHDRICSRHAAGEKGGDA